MPTRRALADELADLINPAPQQEFDPDQGWGQGAVLNASDDELEQQQQRQPTKKVKEKPRLRAGIELDDEVYRGKKSSRASVFGDAAGGNTAPWEDDDGDESDTSSEQGGDPDEDDAEDDSDLLDGADGDTDISASAEEDEGDHEEDDDEDMDEGPRAAKSLKPAGKKRATGRLEANGKVHKAVDGLLDTDNDAGGGDDDDDDDDGLLNGEEDGLLDSGDSEGGEEEEEDEGVGQGDEERMRSHAEAGPHAGREDGNGWLGGDGGDDDVRELEKEYEQMHQEEAQLVRVDEQRGAKEVAKGRAVVCQQRLWEAGLELRIRVQKGLAGAHRLPQPPVRELVLREREDVAERYTGLQEAAHSALASLTSLSSALMQRHPDMAALLQNPPATGTKRLSPEHASPTSTSDWWALLQHQWQAFSPYRDASLDRWHRRTRLASGAGALRSSLKALDQSVSAQVASMMNGPANKRAKRAHMLQSARPRMLCHPPPQATGTQGKEAADPALVHDGEEERALDTYDDGEFYQQLLKELLESGTSGGISYAAMKAQKKRKNVDRRASKGRKIRYHVHEKLVNFATPIETELPPFAEHLFANLFGHRGR